MGMVTMLGVVSGCCCKEVYIDILTIVINFPTPLVLVLFLAAAFLLLCSFFNVFSSCFIYNYTVDFPQQYDKCGVPSGSPKLYFIDLLFKYFSIFLSLRQSAGASGGSRKRRAHNVR